MKFDDYKTMLETEFPKAVRKAINLDDWHYDELKEIEQPAYDHYKDWGFRCISDAWCAAVPKSNTLTLEKSCRAIVEIDCWKMEVTCNTAFSITGGHTHIEVTNKGTTPLPFTETGYKSYFVSLHQFQGGKTIMDFLELQLPETTQLSLF